MQNILRTAIAAGMTLSFVSFGFSDLGAPTAYAGTIKKHHKAHRVQQAPPAPYLLNDIRGNAALGGNNANSAFGSNSANENANGRSGGGFGG